MSSCSNHEFVYFDFSFSVNLESSFCSLGFLCYCSIGVVHIEVKRRPLPDYIEKVQKDVNANMRGILVDWLVEVAEEYMLLSDTLSIHLLHR